jgi:Tfp pilus assembly protein FimV
MHEPLPAPTRGFEIMNRAALLTITLLSFLATPFVVQATTPAPREAAPAVVQAVAVETPAKAAEPACARKVKVVYAGYGEGTAGACPAEAAK